MVSMRKVRKKQDQHGAIESYFPEIAIIKMIWLTIHMNSMIKKLVCL